MELTWTNFFARRVQRITGSQLRSFFSLTERPDIISFAGGFPGSDYFPKPEIIRALTEILAEEGHLALQYTPTEGIYHLRCYLAHKMVREGIACQAKDVIITGGGQQGLDLLGRILINPGDPVLVEEPSYIGCMGTIRSYGGIPTGVKLDSCGVQPVSLERAIYKLRKQGQAPKFFYTVPNFQNPTGYTATLQRRREILSLASRYNFLIVEDNPYGEISFQGAVPPSYKSLDTGERVIYLGSFSKTLAPGIRIGWMVAGSGLREKVLLAKQTADLCSNSLGQYLACRLSKEGLVDRHVRRLINTYRRKRDAMISSMEQCFPPGITFSRPGGGFFIWVSFPTSYPPARELLFKALKKKVAFVHGEGFFCGEGGAHTARFSFSQPPVEDISEGIYRLGKLFTELEESSYLKTVRNP
ncbi:MAG TPA: PLP-dependent aminotransferase family protein [Firmicutes bacterium]|nr:PLP-dependent aminotransferase family protein [Bacillota bacterium]